MDLIALASTVLARMHPRTRAALEKRLRAIPAARHRIDREYTALMDELEGNLKPYRDGHRAYTRLPARGCSPGAIIDEMEALRAEEEARWRDGYVSGAVYHGDQAHIDFLNRVYALNSQSNPLHPDVWPSSAKYEAEVVAMTAAMLGAGESTGDGSGGGICGTVTSGGTESILLAVKTYRDWARDRRGVTRPEMVAPATAHAAFDKAADYFGVRLVKVPVKDDCRADVVAMRRATGRNTILIAGSAPSFPHGTIDPIVDLSELARERGIGFHTDACLGGFVLPWAERLGYPVPTFDFRLPGVTSISADTHKFGYAAKGTSVILYRGHELRRYQYYATADWPGGLYATPTLAGSRPGALSAVAWASLIATGEAGFLEATRQILETATWIKEQIRGIPELRILGDPLWVIAFTSESLDIYRIMDQMAKKRWVLNGLFKPPAVHLCVTLRHAQPGVAGRFVDDLRESVAAVKRDPQARGEMAPVYGMAAGMPLRGLVTDMLKRYLDLLYKV